MLLQYELKKTLFAPVLIVFTVLCITINIVIALVDRQIILDEQNVEPYNVFEGYDTSDLTDYYVARHGMSGKAEENIREKYNKLQSIIDEKAANGDAMFEYFGYETYRMHGLLFGELLFALIAEGCLIALFASLMSTGYENTRNTEQIICTSKTGRRIMRTKLAASLITGLTAFFVILAVSLVVFFTRYDYSTVWNDNISGAFNYAPGEYLKPFITWHSFTVAGFLWAVIGTAAGLTIVFSLLGFAVGTFFRSGYVACGAAVALCLLQFVAMPLFQTGGTVSGVLNLTPVMLWANSGRWFTDGGAGIIHANFESIGLSASLIILTSASVCDMTLYKRRELQ